ncbi:MAG: anti-anti-sigma factor [Verrucomicrobiales bacterium]
MKNETQNPTILAGLFQDLAWVRVAGKGCFQNSPQLREFADRLAADGDRKMVVDLEDCPTMDSTFMGTLTGIAKRVLLNGRMQVVNVNKRNAQLFQNLGLDQILDVDFNGSTWKVERELVRENITRELRDTGLSKVEHSEHVLEAHEELCRANADNVPKFRDVIDFLKQDLAAAKIGEPKADEPTS